MVDFPTASGEKARVDAGRMDPKFLPGFKKRFGELKSRFRGNAGTVPRHRLADPGWCERHQRMVALARQGGHELVFIGDSITQGWEDAGKPVWDEFYARRKSLNLGFSGDRTEQVLWRLLNGELENVDPKIVVLMIGTNNTGSFAEPAATAAGVRGILDLLRERKPAAKIVLHAVFPREASPRAKLRRTNDDLNQRLANFAEPGKIIHLDINRALLAADGTLSPEVMADFLHPGLEGYRRWAEALEPTLIRLGLAGR